MKNLFFVLIFAFSTVYAQESSMRTNVAIAAKTEAALLETWAQYPQQEMTFLVMLAENAIIPNTDFLETKEEKTEFIFQALQQHAARNQQKLIAELTREGVAYQAFWIVNTIAVKGNFATAEKIAAHPEVAFLTTNPKIRQKSQNFVKDELLRQYVTVEWGLTKTKADQVWALGYKGKNIVIAGQDTGYQWDHPSLKNAYRGWNGATADHAYNWHDAIHIVDTKNVGANPCGLDSKVPCDDHGHGTHTMGTMVGLDPANGNAYGMAPEAKWISCRNMERGWGMPTTYLECMQWFLAPTDLENKNPDPKKAPHIISNSWGCPPEEGCTSTHFDLIETAISNLRKAGIAFVAAAGNENPANAVTCGSVQNPPGISPSAFVVAATDETDKIASFSSRGPVTVDGSKRAKPDISAPGVRVRSTVPNNTYSSSSGTSMATPHVAGLMALMISANPRLAGRAWMLEDMIRKTAFPLVSVEGCGGLGATTVPNMTFGHGRIDALAAVQLALSTPVVNDDDVPTRYTISKAYPNPFNDLTHLQFSVAEAQFVSVKVFDLMGREVEHVFSGNVQPQAMQTLILQAQQLQNGVYFVQIKGEKFTETQKVVLMR